MATKKTNQQVNQINAALNQGGRILGALLGGALDLTAGILDLTSETIRTVSQEITNKDRQSK